MQNLPNKITGIRILAIPIIMYFLLSGMNLAALGLFLFSALTDFLDGYLARSGDRVSSFGKFADPIADKVLVSAVFITFIQLGELSVVVVVIVIAREFLVTGLRLLGSSQNKVIAASPLGKGKTVFQLVLIVSILVVREWDLSILAEAIPIIVYLVIAATVVSGMDYAYRNRQLIREAFT